ncbi:MAG: LLM class F420-dependent oxidoreductase [Actinomycetia bacterium]|nr:LLM class F420-dependent oxidoreductase [Actinomycetes bacterium]
MDYGILAFATDQSTTPAESARLAEEHGFESIWFPEHSHLPVASGGWPGGDRIPDVYARTVDQWVALGMAAAVTDTIRLGTGMCLVPQHDPVWLAKMAASVDHLSGGRLTMGLGYVWNRAELADHGIEFSTRRARTRECVEVMRALWTDEVASYQGEHVKLSASQAWPKPPQAGGPPIVIGAGVGPRTLTDLVDWADGWAPMFGRDDIEGKLPEVRQALADAGRDEDGFEVSVFGVPPEPEAIDQVRGWGVQRIVFGAGGADVERMASGLARIRKVIQS